tara:strand:+ start:7226 stop:8791 length:1566 start_codon:yes stop_codon:yes gene_type:complete
MALTAQEIKKRYDIANKEKENFRALYEECYEYALPNRNLYDGFYSSVSGQKKLNKVFDSTAISSTQRAANRIQSNLFPPQRNWCRLQPGEEIEEKFQVDLQRMLDAYTDKLFGVLRQSDFDLAMGEFLLDLMVGTAVMQIMPGDETKPIRFNAIPSFLVTFEEGPHGTVDNVYRRIIRAYETLEKEWPDIEIPQEIKDQYQDRPQEKIEILEATLHDRMKGVYDYVLIDKAGGHILLRRELKSTPWVVARWMKVAGETMGRGPLVTVINDIKTLNKVVELTLKNASLSIGGVFTAADDGVLNPSTIQIVPGSIISVARNGGPQGESLKPLPRTGDPQMGQLVANDLRTAIKKGLLDESLPPENMSARSATEIQARLSELAQNLGSAFGRLIVETMMPIVRRSLEVMDAQGMIELPLKVNGLQVKVVPESPLAMAQNMDKVGEVMQYLQITQMLGPEGVMAVNMGRIADYLADQLGIPAKLRNTPEEKDAIAAQMQEAAQMAAQQQMGAEGEQAPPEDAAIQ